MFGAIAEDVRPGRARVGWPWRLGWRMVVWSCGYTDRCATRGQLGMMQVVSECAARRLAAGAVVQTTPDFDIRDGCR